MVKQIMIWVTSGPDNPEKAVLPFIIANAGFVHDAKVYVMLAGSGVWLAKKGVAEHVNCCKWKLQDLLNNFLESGGELVVCSPCMQERDMSEEELIDGARIGAAVEVLQIASECDVVLTF